DTPPQQFIRLQHMSSIENCQHCGRFLVWMSGLDTRRPAADIADAAAE
ncbi:MAG: hypothetical protein H6703_17320, partial [Myxococcales bacterium]|nr:hypothetical protein [Myxococcales bacterium]